MKKVYVAGPYSRGDVMVNIRAALFAADWLLALGYAPFVPHLTGFWHFYSPKPYKAWLALDLEWLRACDAVLRLPGESPGADGEVAEAERLGIPVYESVPELAGGLV
jgi:hypothetical protein